MKIKEGDIVLCTVKKIDGAHVFLEIDGDGEGIMIMSEVAAGRIRNLNEYVVVNKKVVCKVLRVGKDHAELSLRRVSAKEREEVLSRYKRERAFSVILKNVLKNHSDVIKKIKEKMPLWEFFDYFISDPKIGYDFMSKEECETLSKLISEKENKDIEVKKEIKISSLSSEGIKDIKEILNVKEAEITYLGSSRFLISVRSKEAKIANKKLNEILNELEKKAKEKKAIFEVK